MQRKTMILGIIILFFIGNFASAFTIEIYKMNKQFCSGDILYVGGNGPGNFTKIQDAIDNASSGDIIFVYNGTYYENVMLYKSINLIGEKKENTIIDGGEMGIPIKVMKSYIYISSFTIKNCISRGEGIQVLTENNIDISDCDILNCYGNGSSGIEFSNVFDSSIKDCNFYNNTGKGIKINNCENIEIESCFIENSYNGIIVWFSSYLKINNTFTINNEDGINVWSSTNVDIFNNVVSDNNRKGITISYCEKDSNIDICNNSILNNGHGIFYFNAGIFIQYCKDDITIEYNNIKNNDPYGIYIICSSFHKIMKNNFIENNISAYILYSINPKIFYPNSWEYNYWDDWIGLKFKFARFFPKVIRGSYDFIIPWFDLDLHPVKEPYKI